jgi:transketolase
MNDATFRTFVLTGDGELQEGSNWEAAMAASQFGLDRLTVIVDRNGLQQGDFTERTVGLEPLADRWRAFGWGVVEVDGHDIPALINTLEQLPFAKGHPTCIIARTHKGRGVSFIEDRVEWHHRVPGTNSIWPSRSSPGAHMRAARLPHRICRHAGPGGQDSRIGLSATTRWSSNLRRSKLFPDRLINVNRRAEWSASARDWPVRQNHYLRSLVFSDRSRTPNESRQTSPIAHNLTLRELSGMALGARPDTPLDKDLAGRAHCQHDGHRAGGPVGTAAAARRQPSKACSCAEPCGAVVCAKTLKSAIGLLREVPT